MILLSLTLLLAGPAASPTPNPLAAAIAAYPDCAKTNDDARALACDYGVRLVSREPRKATVLFVAMWSNARFQQPTVTSPDGLHIAPAAPVAGPPPVAQPVYVGNPIVIPDASVPELAEGLAIYGIGAAIAAHQRADARHDAEMQRKVWTALVRSVYERGNDDYSRAMLPALAAIDWNSPDSIDRFVAAHEAALAADAAKAAPAQPAPPTRP